MGSKESDVKKWDELRGAVEEALRPQDAEAAREIGRLIEALQAQHAEQNEQIALLRRRLREAGKARVRSADARYREDDFLTILNHALRSPLAPIFSAVERLQLPNLDDSTLQRQREMIGRQASRIGRILDNLLEVSRLLRGKIKLRKEKVDLREAADRVLEDAGPALRERGHQLAYSRPPEPLWVMGDAHRLRQILASLIENAVKYTEAGGRIEVALAREPGPKPGEDSIAALRVSDTGVGVTREMLPHVFDLFTRAGPALDRSQCGLGIGLTMARCLVELHGGTIQSSSPGPGKGSLFIVQLPLVREGAPKRAKRQTLPPRAAQAEAEAQTGRRILVVEDNVDSARSLADLLEIWGHQVRITHEGPAALAAALAFLPEVVLLDIGLPGMNGYQVARLMRTQPGLKASLLVAVTGYSRDEDRQRAKDAGIDRHFTKPIDLAELQMLLGQPPMQWLPKAAASS